MLTDAQKADVRRHLDYGIIGINPTGGSLVNYRFFIEYGLLEFRLNNLRPEEETILLGTGSQVTPINPNFQDPSTDTYYDGYVRICNFLEGQIGLSTDSFDIQQAGSYRSYDNEMQKRIALYNYWRKRMADFLQLPLNPHKFNNTSKTNVPVIV